MKRIAFILLITHFLLGFTAASQTVKGRVTDEGNDPLPKASITLLTAADSSVVKLTAADRDGQYSFEGITPGSYLLQASHSGYATGTIPVTMQGDPLVTVAPIVLSKVSRELKGVVVQARKPLVELRGDKTIVNVEGTINAIGNTVLELLRKSPGVTLDKDEKISLSGKNGVQVYINGRPSPLSGADLTAYLRTLPSDAVEALEIMTQPPARFSAAGNAGIINIRLKKAKTMGTNGSISSGYNIGYYGKYNGGVSLNHRTARLNLFGNYQYNKGTARKEMIMERRLIDSLFAQQGNFKDRSSTHTFNTGIDLFLNPQSTLGLVANGAFSEGTISNYSATPISHLASGTVSRVLIADNRFYSDRSHLDLNGNYLYTGKEGRSLNLNADYGYYHLGSDQLQPNQYFAPDRRTLLSTTTFQMVAPGTIDIYSLKGDWEQPLGKGKLGAGAKSSFVDTDNDFRFYHVGPNERVLDRDGSNRFHYREAIQAGYLSYQRAFKNISLNAGLRLEHTSLEGRTTGLKANGTTYSPYDSTLQRNYTDLFPTLSLSYTKWQDHQLSLSIGRRIDRPYYQDLNPFEFKVDAYITQAGNTELKPAYTWSLGLQHSYKSKLTSGLQYSRVTDMITWLLDTANKTGSLVQKRNLAEQDLVSFNLSYPLQYKAYSLFAHLTTNYAQYKADFGTGRTYNESALGLNVMLQQSLRFGKGFTAELTGFYNAPTVHEGNMHTRSMWSLDAGLQKKVLRDNGTLKLALSDVGHTLKFRASSTFAGQTTFYQTRYDSRQLKLSFAYRFGNKEVKSARQRKSGAAEEMNRVQ